MEIKSGTWKVRKAVGSFTCRIEGFSGFSREAGKYSESDMFELCGMKWKLQLFPGGCNQELRGNHMSLFLLRVAPFVEGRISFEVSLRDQLCGKHHVTLSAMFGSKSVYGWERFIPVSDLLNAKKGLCHNDTIIFKIQIALFTDSCHFIKENPANLTDYHSLEDYMKTMMDDQSIPKDAIFRFTYSPDMITAHRAVLMTRSAVFRAMFTSKYAEANTGEIIVEDIDPDVMKELLHFMYTNNFSDESFLRKKAPNLLLAATKYEVPEAKAECELFLANGITVESLSRLMILADSCNARILKERCVEFGTKYCPQIFMDMKYIRASTEYQQE
jgi:speckle-type POZ protein